MMMMPNDHDSDGKGSNPKKFHGGDDKGRVEDDESTTGVLLDDGFSCSTGDTTVRVSNVRRESGVDKNAAQGEFSDLIGMILDPITLRSKEVGEFLDQLLLVIRILLKPDSTQAARKAFDCTFAVATENSTLTAVDRANIIDLILGVPEHRRHDFLAAFKAAVARKNNMKDFEELIGMILDHVTYGSEGRDLLLGPIRCLLQPQPAHEWRPFFVGAFATATADSTLTDDDRANVVDLILGVPGDRRGDFLAAFNAAVQTRNNMEDFEDLIGMILDHVTYGSEGRDLLLGTIRHLFEPDMDQIGRLAFEGVFQLATRNSTLTNDDRANVVRLILGVPGDRRGDFLAAFDAAVQTRNIQDETEAAIVDEEEDISPITDDTNANAGQREYSSGSTTLDSGAAVTREILHRRHSEFNTATLTGNAQSGDPTNTMRRENATNDLAALAAVDMENNPRYAARLNQFAGDANAGVGGNNNDDSDGRGADNNDDGNTQQG